MSAEKKDKVQESISEVKVQETLKKELRAIDKYKGKFIIKICKSTWLEQIDPKHDGTHLFSEAKHFVPPDRHKDTGLIVTGLTEQEQKDLEIEMGFKPMDLSPYSPTWGNYKLYPQIPQSGLELDLERSALDKLRYLYLRVKSNVALSNTEALENPLAEYIMTSAEKEAKSESKKIKIKLDAMKRLSEMTFNEQMDFLKVYKEGKFKVTKSSTPDFILSIIGRVADEDPVGFLETADNPDFKTLVFVQDAILGGHIRKSGPKYFIPGGDLIGNTLLDVVYNLQKPEYNEVKISIKAKMDAVK